MLVGYLSLWDPMASEEGTPAGPMRARELQSELQKLQVLLMLCSNQLASQYADGTSSMLQDVVKALDASEMQSTVQKVALSRKLVAQNRTSKLILHYYRS